MKKLALFTLTLFSVVFSVSAQWELDYAIDEDSKTKIPQLIYDLEDPAGFVRYIDSSLEVQYYGSDVAEFLDMLWRERTNPDWITFNTDVDIYFLGNAPQEFCYDVEISNIEKGEKVFEFGLDDEDHSLLKAMKANKTMEIHFYDEARGRPRLLSIPLTGITTLCQKARF